MNEKPAETAPARTRAEILEEFADRREFTFETHCLSENAVDGVLSVRLSAYCYPDPLRDEEAGRIATLLISPERKPADGELWETELAIDAPAATFLIHALGALLELAKEKSP